MREIIELDIFKPEGRRRSEKRIFQNRRAGDGAKRGYFRSKLARDDAKLDISDVRGREAERN